MQSKIRMDGRMVAWEDAKVHVLAHGFHYGTGVFEGIRVYHTPQGKNVFRLREHMERFLNSAKVLQMKVPYSLDELCEACRDVVRTAGPEGDYLPADSLLRGASRVQDRAGTPAAGWART